MHDKKFLLQCQYNYALRAIWCITEGKSPQISIPQHWEIICLGSNTIFLFTTDISVRTAAIIVQMYEEISSKLMFGLTFLN